MRAVESLVQEMVPPWQTTRELIGRFGRWPTGRLPAARTAISSDSLEQEFRPALGTKVDVRQGSRARAGW